MEGGVRLWTSFLDGPRRIYLSQRGWVELGWTELSLDYCRPPHLFAAAAAAVVAENGTRSRY